MAQARNIPGIIAIHGVDEPVKISMNEPMRFKGYTFFQASWGPQNAGPDDPKFSQFEVAKNPSDHWPLWSCIAAFIGLAIHFSMGLWKFSKRSATKKSPVKSDSAPEVDDPAAAPVIQSESEKLSS